MFEKFRASASVGEPTRRLDVPPGNDAPSAGKRLFGYLVLTRYKNLEWKIVIGTTAFPGREYPEVFKDLASAEARATSEASSKGWQSVVVECMVMGIWEGYGGAEKIG